MTIIPLGVSVTAVSVLVMNVDARLEDGHETVSDRATQLVPVLLVAMLFFVLAAPARGFALVFGAFVELMALGNARGGRVALDGIGMRVDGAVVPASLPNVLIDEDAVGIPREPIYAPAPGAKGRADGDAETEIDCAADEESRARTIENDGRVIVGDADEGRIYGQDFDVRSTTDDHLRVAAEISKIAGLAAHALNGVHDIWLLREECVTEIGGPAHIRSHHVEDGRERQQSLHARIPRQAVFGDGASHLVTAQVVVLIGPTGGIGDFVGKRGGGENLGEQGIGVERDARNHAVEFLWWKRGRRLRQTCWSEAPG